MQTTENIFLSILYHIKTEQNMTPWTLITGMDIFTIC